MGNSEGKTIGQWFGPNTIAQVLRYDGEFLENELFYAIDLDVLLRMNSTNKFMFMLPWIIHSFSKKYVSISNSS